MDSYTLRSIQSMLGISRAVISGLIAAGFVTPTRGKRREYQFTFQDVVLLRTAYELQRAGIPARKILRSLRELRTRLPAELPLTGLRIAAVGSEIAVRDGETQWQAETGQLLLDFELERTEGAAVSFLVRTRQVPSDTLPDWFSQGVELEPQDKDKAEAAYRKAIQVAPDRVDAYLNLGVMLSDAGRDAEAVALYREALRHCPGEALLHYNLAVALEDLQLEEEALQSYERCLRLAPNLADAHYNVARLHEMLGHARKAIRHYSEYRRLQR